MGNWKLLSPALLLGLVVWGSTASAQDKWYFSGLEWQRPPVVDPGTSGGPPSDAVVLFDGKDLSAWADAENWRVEDGLMVNGGGSIHTRQPFGDFQLHVEWMTPPMPDASGQDRGNSGLYIMGLYEVQILDSYENETYFDGQAGAIYKQTPPMVNAMRPPNEWNTFDVAFTAPRFNEDGTLTSPAYVTLLHNGVLVQNHVELVGGTRSDLIPKYRPHAEKLPLYIQDHGNPVRFRNIWAREIKPLTSERIHEPELREE